MKKETLLFTLTVFLIGCSSQLIFAQDKVLLKDGSLVEGELSRAEWIHNREVILTTTDENDKKIETATIQKVFISNKVYELNSQRVILNAINSTKKHVFLEILIDGTARMLKYPSGASIHFISTKDTLIVIDLNVFDKEGITAQEKRKYEYEFKTALMKTLRDCGEINFKTFDDLIFSEVTIKNLVKKYNTACGELKYEPVRWSFKETKYKNRLRLDIYGGYNSPRFFGYLNGRTNFTNRLSYHTGPLKDNQPIIGINASYVFNNFKIRPSIEVGGTYQRFFVDTVGFSLRVGNALPTRYYRSAIDASFIKIYAGLGSEIIATDKLRIGVGLGFHRYQSLNVDGILITYDNYTHLPPISRIDYLTKENTSPTYSRSYKLVVRYSRLSATFLYERGRRGLFGIGGEYLFNYSWTVGYNLVGKRKT